MGVHPKYKVGDVVRWRLYGYYWYGVVCQLKTGGPRVKYLMLPTDPFGNWAGDDRIVTREAHQLEPVLRKTGKPRRNTSTVADWKHDALTL